MKDNLLRSAEEAAVKVQVTRRAALPVTAITQTERNGNVKPTGQLFSELLLAL